MNKAIKLVLFLMLLSSVFLVSCSKNVDLTGNEKKNIALIVKMNSGNHWATIKLGGDAAAREYNVNIDYNGSNSEDDFNGQIKLVNQALEKKVDALILAASDFKALVPVTENAYEQHIPVIIIDSEVDTDNITSYIATDNLDAGKKAGVRLIEIAGKSCNVAIMSFVKGSRNAELREMGLMNILSQYPEVKVVAKEYCFSEVSLANQLAQKIIRENTGLDAFVTFNDIATEGVADAVDQMNMAGKIKIIGFDSSSKEIDYLDKGVIQATIAQKPFNIGYLSVKYAVDAINGKSIEKFIKTDSAIIDANNMYLPENQKLIFPFVK